MKTNSFPSETFECCRIYLNGDVRQETYQSKSEKDEWFQYNSDFRPGCALVINGAVVARGYYGSDGEILIKLDAWKNRLAYVKNTFRQN